MARTVIGGNRNSISRDLRNALRVEGLKETVQKLERIVDAATGREMKQVYYAAGKEFRDEAKTLAPFDPERKEGTHLRDAIFVSWGKDEEPNVLVGVRTSGESSAPHAHFLEYGWEDGEAQPFMRPAAAAAAPRITKIIGGGLIKIVERFSS